MGSLAASLLRVHSTVCLAVAEIVGFRRKTDDDTLWILSINLEELEDKAASLTVTVQLLDMFTRDASTVAAERCTWQWNHSYI